jgi:hypothetical protein
VTRDPPAKTCPRASPATRGDADPVVSHGHDDFPPAPRGGQIWLTALGVPGAVGAQVAEYLRQPREVGVEKHRSAGKRHPRVPAPPAVQPPSREPPQPVPADTLLPRTPGNLDGASASWRHPAGTVPPRGRSEDTGQPVLLPGRALEDSIMFGGVANRYIRLP